MPWFRAFILVLGATGGILAFEPQLDRLLHRHVSYVKPGERILSLVEIGEAVARKYPGEPVVAYLPSEAADLPHRVILSRGIVSVNQHTGEILGVRTRGQTFLGIIRALHVRLAAGDAGRLVLKWASVGLLFSLISGLYLLVAGQAIADPRFYGEHKVLVRFARRCRYLLIPALAGAGGKWNHPRF